MAVDKYWPPLAGGGGSGGGDRHKAVILRITASGGSAD